MLLRFIFFAFLIFATVAALAGEVLDRVLAVVNGHVILLSEWDDAVRLESFMSGNKLQDVGLEERKAVLDRLIDQELLRQQMRASDIRPVDTDETQKQMDSFKADYLRQHAGESWEMALSKSGLAEGYIKNHVQSELELLQFVDARFRPSIQVSADEVEKYYRNQFLPALSPSDPISQAEATPKLREILVQQKINQMLTSWLQTLHTQAQIQILPITPGPDSRPSQAGAQ